MLTGILEYPTGSSATANVRDRVLQSILYLGDPGEPRLPSERELAGMLGVERGTVRAALIELSAVGLVTSRRGRYGGTSWIEVSPLALPFQAPSDRLHRRAKCDLASIQELAWRFVRSSGTSIDEALIEGARNALTSGQGEFWADARLNGAIWAAAGGSVLALAGSTAHLALVRGRQGPTQPADHGAMLKVSLRAARGRIPTRDIADHAAEYVRLLAG